MIVVKERAILFHYYLQSPQCMERILCILKVPSFGITFIISLTPVPQYFNLKEIYRFL